MEHLEPPEPEPQPGRGTPDDLKRRRELEMVDDGDLDEFEITREAAHLARLAADRALLDELGAGSRDPAGKASRGPWRSTGTPSSGPGC